MPECVHRLGGVESIAGGDSLGHRHDHRLVSKLRLLDVLKVLLGGELTLREIYHVRRRLAVCAQYAGTCRQPAGVPAHDLNYGDRGNGIHAAVADYLLEGRSNVLRRRAESRSVVGFSNVVVDGLWNTNDADSYILCREVAVQLHNGVHRVISADVEECPDIVAVEHLCNAEVIRFVLVPVLQLESAGAEYR